MEGQVSLFGPDLEYGKTCLDATPAEPPEAPTSKRSSRRSCGLKNHTLMLLDLREDAGNMLGSYWEYDPPWLGSLGTLNTSECPSDAVESSLSRILQAIVPFKYYLSSRACRGMLRRSKKRGKLLPKELELAAMIQAGLIPISSLYLEKGQVEISPFTAGFSSGAGASAGSIGYQEETAPTLKAAASGSMMPSVLCINDQGGSVMDCSEDVAGTLRAQEHGHQPLVMATQQGGAEIGVGICPTITAAAGLSGNNQPVLFENHGIDSRYTGPHNVSPTLSHRTGTGGNNLPIMLQECPKAYTRQWVDVFKDDDIASTESARQHKDATDLVLQEAETEIPLLIRRLTPLECERLQGFPDGWTDLPGASDSSRYKALGNSVAIPCVEYIMRGIAMALGA